LGASGVQVGTAYLRTPEARISALHREALRTARAEDSVLTNVFTGRPARSIKNRFVRELGPLAGTIPAFPAPAALLAPLRSAAENAGSGEFSSLWSGQAGPLGRDVSARHLTRLLADEALERFHLLKP
jgi:nitronate monooxygenase